MSRRAQADLTQFSRHTMDKATKAKLHLEAYYQVMSWLFCIWLDGVFRLDALGNMLHLGAISIDGP